MKLTQRLAIGYIQTKFKLISVISKRKTAEKAFKLFCTPQIKVKTNRLPVNAEQINFNFNRPNPAKKQIIIRGYRWNHPRPHKVLILHGFGSAAHKFEHYVSPLVTKGYEVLAFDAPAHGKSGGTTINAVEYSAMIRKVLELYGPVKGFLAHSFGGMALSLALENTKQEADTRIVLIAPATETVSAIDAAFRMLKLNDTEVRKEFDDIIFALNEHPAAWYSIRRAVRHINAKLLWVHDEDDRITPLSDALKVKEDNHTNIDFLITKGLGHQKIYRDNEIKKQVVDFL